jgi:hypothetical protein
MSVVEVWSLGLFGAGSVLVLLVKLFDTYFISEHSS